MIAVIDFTKDAKEFCALDRNNLRIFITDDNGNEIETRPYNTYEYERIKNMNIPIVEKMDTSSCRIPLKDPMFFGRLQIK